MCPLLQEREQTLRKNSIQTTQCTVKTSSQRRTFKRKSGTHTSIASFLTSILPGAQGGVEKDVRKKLIVCRKSQVMKRLAYQTMTWTRSFRNLSCVVTCVQWIAKKLRKTQSKEGNYEIIAVINKRIVGKCKLCGDNSCKKKLIPFSKQPGFLFFFHNKNANCLNV